MPQISRVRGTRDIVPSEQPRWQHLLRAADRSADLFGFRRLDTPLIEPLELFERAVGEATDVVEKEMYAFEDRGGRRVVLRPEATAAVMRAYFEDGLREEPQPVRLHTSGPMFRYDRPQKGRYRQFHQFNAEIIGDGAPGYDVEVIALMLDFLRHAGLGQGLSLQLNSIGDAKCRPAYRQALIDYYTPLSDQLCEKCRARLQRNPLRLLDCKEPGCLRLMAAAPAAMDHLCDECRAHLAQVRHMLEAQGIAHEMNPRLVRGLDYYTRTAFEVWHEALGGAQNSLGGGGRYDGLAATLGWPETPGVGFAVGLDRIASLLPAIDDEPAKVGIIPISPDDVAPAMTIAGRLRATGVSSVVQASDRGLRASLRHAQKLRVSHVVILGREELERGMVRVKPMTGEGPEELVQLEALTARLGGLAG